MAGVTYQFCVGCEYRRDTETTVSCPADFNPYNENECPRHKQYMALRALDRMGKAKKKRFK